MDALNYVVLISGLALIGVFWYAISTKEREKETLIVTASLFVLGIAVYFVQSTVWPL